MSNLKVLVAEDDHVNRRYIETLLRRRNCNVMVVENGRQAVEAVREQGPHFDVVLMDVMMPELGGFDATAAIRAIESSYPGLHMPIIAMTARALKGDREECLAAGMDAYVSKPINREELWQAIESALQVRRTVAPSAASIAPPREPLDREALIARFDGDAELLLQILDLYDQTSAQCLEKLAAAVAAGDFPGVAAAAHKLAGSVGNLCAPDALHAARKVEELIRSGAHGEVPAAIAAMNSEMTRLAEALVRFRNTLASTG